MICISVAPESRKLARADLLNASNHCDIIELCLDRLKKAPDVGEMIEGFEKPILISCRRPQDGGKWEGTEDERLQLLRNAIIAGPAYVELELDIADKIPRFGDVKRVISFTSIDKPLSKVDDIFERAYKAKADVVKFTWPTPTLNAAWPLLVAATESREIPVVGMGLGRASLMFSLLARKYGAPWIYAALEKGMEAHEGQATVWELNDDFAWQDINRKSRFIGVVGLDKASTTSVRVLNTAFKEMGSNVRCLPLALGPIEKLRKMLDVLKIPALLVSPQAGSALLALSDKTEDVAGESGYVDLLLKKDSGWHGYNAIRHTATRAMEKSLTEATGDQSPLDRRSIMIIGSGNLARAVAAGMAHYSGMRSISAPDDAAAQEIAQKFDMRHVPYASVYERLTDVLVIADSRIQAGPGTRELNPTVLREQMTIVDISQCPDETEFLKEARERGCRVVDPKRVYTNQLAAQFKTITGKALPESALNLV